MHVDVKRLGVMSVFAALSIILLYLGEIISINTLFFVIGASFIVGMVCTKYGGKLGLLFLFVCFGLSLLLLPNKWHCITYVVFGINVLVIQRTKNYLIRLLIFNFTYIPIIVFLPKLIIAREMTSNFLMLAIVIGQGGYLFLCYVYWRFKREIGKKLLDRLF